MSDFRRSEARGVFKLIAGFRFSLTQLDSAEAFIHDRLHEAADLAS